jgi:UDP-GlcNAc:undecaprenyl-phosphate GlcNAc-1-phosphate transferase
MVRHAQIILAAGGLSLVLTPLLRALGRRFALLDHPHGDLKDHAAPVPNVGGLAITAAAVTGLLLFFPAGQGRPLGGVLAGAAIILVLGIVDDRRPLSSTTKLPVQLAAAVVAYAFGVRITIAFLPEWANAFLTLAWLVGITNAVNIIDVMDGLAGGVSAIAALAFYALALGAGDAGAVAVAAACLGACAGFLPYNWEPASIFMGDAGSGTVGFLLAATAVLLGYSAVNEVAWLSPVLILAVPIYDTVLVVCFRAGAGRPVLQGSRDHFALRLVALGHSPKAAVAMAYAVSALSGIVSLLLVRVSLPAAVTLLAVLAAVFGAAGVYLTRARPETDATLRGRAP